MDKIFSSLPPHRHLMPNTIISFRDCCHGLLTSISISALALYHHYKARSLLHETRSFQNLSALSVQNPNRASPLCLNKIKILYPALKHLCDLASASSILQECLFFTLVQPSSTSCSSLGVVNSILASGLFHLPATLFP